MSEHKKGLVPGFSKRYGVQRLIYYEMWDAMDEAILREKRLKEWRRAWKLRLIQSMNPEWADLFDVSCGVLDDGPADIARGH